jgi:hypothetical protein
MIATIMRIIYCFVKNFLIGKKVFIFASMIRNGYFTAMNAIKPNRVRHINHQVFLINFPTCHTHGTNNKMTTDKRKNTNTSRFGIHKLPNNTKLHIPKDQQLSVNGISSTRNMTAV